jgi:hypothetical protein
LFLRTEVGHYCELRRGMVVVDGEAARMTR